MLTLRNRREVAPVRELYELVIGIPDLTYDKIAAAVKANEEKSMVSMYRVTRITDDGMEVEKTSETFFITLPETVLLNIDADIARYESYGYLPSVNRDSVVTSILEAHYAPVSDAKSEDLEAEYDKD